MVRIRPGLVSRYNLLAKWRKGELHQFLVLPAKGYANNGNKKNDGKYQVKQGRDKAPRE